MKLLATISLLLLFSFSNSFGQCLRNMTTLPTSLNENSGMIMTSNNNLWIHNDSGNEPFLYKIDSNGVLLDTIKLIGVIAKDWEDITQDAQGNVYIGDFGNNSHNRTDLVIYKIPNPDNILVDSVVPQEIKFTYSDQTVFPDPDQNKDCEAMFHHNNSLYLISKNWGNGQSSNFYKLPDSPGTYVANLFDSLISPMITGADMHPSGRLAILSMNSLFLIDSITGDDFRNGRSKVINLALSQKEGICFSDSNTILISQEHHSIFPGAKIFQLTCPAFSNVSAEPQSTSSLAENSFEDLVLYPNPAQNYISISSEKSIKNLNSATIQIINMNGQVISSIIPSNLLDNSINISNFESGMYFLRITTHQKQSIHRFIKT